MSSVSHVSVSPGPSQPFGFLPVKSWRSLSDSRTAARWSGRRCIAPCLTPCPMNSQPASSIARATGSYERTTLALMAAVARILRRPSASSIRQKPTRMPYSCHAQLGTSGTVVTPWGAVRYWRAIGFSMSHSSMLTMVHTAIRAPLGSLQARRVAMGEYSKRSCGNLTRASLCLVRTQGGPIVQSRAVAQPPAVDIHAHFFPESFLRVIEEHGGPFGARVDRANPKGPAIATGGITGPPLDATYWDLDRRVRAMDKAGVQIHALSLTTPMVHWARGDVARRAAEAVNDAMAEAHRAYPDRFIGCATLPMHEPPLAQGELERVATLKGIRAVYLGTNVNGRELSAPEFAPVFARLEALGLPVLLHPISVVGAERLRPFYLHNLLGNPFDTAIAAAHLVFGGVLDRHPKLQVCLPHAGGALPYLVGRLGHGQRVRPEARERARRPFERYLRRFTYDTISHSGDALRYLIATVGADRVMLGSDFCFDMGYERPRDIITKRARLSKADQARVLGGNALRLLRLS